MYIKFSDYRTEITTFSTGYKILMESIIVFEGLGFPSEGFSERKIVVLNKIDHKD